MEDKEPKDIELVPEEETSVDENTEPEEADAAEPEFIDIDNDDEIEIVEEPEPQLTPIPKKKKKSKKRKKLTKIIVIAVILLGIAAAVFFYMRNKSKKAREAAIASMNNNLKTESITRNDLTENISVTGKINSNESRTLLTTLQTSSKILSVNVKVGDYVNEGDTLVTFSTEDIEKEIARAEEDLSRQKQLDSITAADNQRNYVYSYQQAADTLADNAKTTERALKALYEACDVYGSAKRALQAAKDEGKSDAEIAQLENQVANAKSAEEKAQQTYDDAVAAEASGKGLESVQNSLSSADSTYQTSLINSGEKAREKERSIQDQKDKLANYVVNATMGGLVTNVNVVEGNSFKEGEVLTIQDVSKYTVEAEIDEYNISKVAEGQRVLIRTEATGDEEFDGVVSLINPIATSGSSGSSSSFGSSSSSSVTYTVKVDMLDMDPRIKLGMTAKMSIIVDEAEDALCVPYNAVGQNANGESVIYLYDGEGGNQFPGADAPDIKTEVKTESGIVVERDKGKNNESMPEPGKADSGSDRQMPATNYHEVVVEKGISTDLYIQVISDEIKEGDKIVIKKADDSSSGQFEMGGFSLLGGMGGAPGGGPGGGPGGPT